MDEERMVSAVGFSLVGVGDVRRNLHCSDSVEWDDRKASGCKTPVPLRLRIKVYMLTAAE